MLLLDYKIGDVYGAVLVFMLHVVQILFKIVPLGKHGQQQYPQHV